VAILFTEDDLLWWRLRPTPDSELDFQYADQFVAVAEQNWQLVLGAHLVRDEGFGEEWTEDDLRTATHCGRCRELRVLDYLLDYRHVTENSVPSQEARKSAMWRGSVGQYPGRLDDSRFRETGEGVPGHING